MIDLAQVAVGAALGKGGQGTVYVASSGTGNRLAVKLLQPSPALDRPLFEARAKSFSVDPLAGPPFSPILAVGALGDAPVAFRRQLPGAPKGALYVVTPFIEGATAAELGETWSLLEVTALLDGVAKLLLRFPAGLGHGDLRVPNVFVRPKGELVLADPDLFRSATPREDLAGLGRMGTELLGKAQITGQQMARNDLKMLCADLEGEPAPEIHETLARLGKVAAALRGVTATALIPAVERALRDRPQPAAPGARPRGSLREGRRVPRWLLIAGWSMAALCALANFGLRQIPLDAENFYPHYERAVNVTGSPVVKGFSDSAFYARPGKVRYPEQVHPLKPEERAAAEDGIIQATVEEKVPRIAILTPRKDLLWEVKSPPEGGLYYFDVKPGHYIVEIDRELPGGKVQIDQQPIRVDVEHPFRFLASNTVISAPGPDGERPTAPWDL